MQTRGRRLAAVTAAAGLALAWAIAQLLLARHTQIAMFHHELRARIQFLAMHPTLTPPLPVPVNTRWWLFPAVESLIALLACSLVATMTAAGGRRRWALLPAALPLTLLLGRGDGNSLGLGWLQPFSHMYAWLTVGALVDALVVAGIAVLLGFSLPRRRATTPIAPAVLRTLPIAVIAFGYWFVGHPFPDAHDRLFVTRTLLLVLSAAVIASLRLPLAGRTLVLLVLPFTDPTMADGLIGGYQTWWTYLHHVDVAAATMAYVLGVPYLASRFRQLRPSVTAA